MAELPRHVDAILYALATLRTWFASYERVQVGANMFLYYQEGDNSKRVTPDLFVARGLAALPERSYKLWEAGRPPGFVLEVASPSTEDRDCGEKQALYAAIGVTEYWRFHPTGELKAARSPGLRLEGGTLQGLGYAPLALRRDGSIDSAVLDLNVRVDEREGRSHLLRFRDPKTWNDLLTFEESEQGRQAAEQDRQAAEQGRQQALRRWQAAERRHQAAERRHRAAERRHQAAERRHQAAEQEIARLKTQIARLESQGPDKHGSES